MAFFSRLTFIQTGSNILGRFWRAALQDPCLCFSRPARWAEVTTLCGRQTARAIGLSFLLPALLAVGKHASICFSPFRQKIKLAKIFPAGSQEALFKFSQGEGATQQSQYFPAENFNLRKDNILLEQFIDRKHLEIPFQSFIGREMNSCISQPQILFSFSKLSAFDHSIKNTSSLSHSWPVAPSIWGDLAQIWNNCTHSKSLNLLKHWCIGRE